MGLFSRSLWFSLLSLDLLNPDPFPTVTLLAPDLMQKILKYQNSVHIPANGNQLSTLHALRRPSVLHSHCHGA